MYKNTFQLLLYNDLFFYKISKNEWHNVTSPSMPPPRCSHQVFNNQFTLD